MSRNRYFTIIVIMGLCAVSYGWRSFAVLQPLKTAKEMISSSKPVMVAIEAYREETGTFPETLDDLVPEYFKAVPVPGSGSSSASEWKYSRLAKDEYQIYATFQHSVSAYDAVAYRSSEVYPPSWSDKAEATSLEKWLYLVGAQRIDFDNP